MKISARQYAQCLYELVDTKSETEIKDILSKFVTLLNKHRDLNLAPAIMSSFLDIWSKASGEVMAELTIARALKVEAKEIIINYLKEKSASQKVILEEKIDHKILGGFILKYNNKIVDGSLKNNLEDLKNSLKA